MKFLVRKPVLTIVLLLIAAGSLVVGCDSGSSSTPTAVQSGANTPAAGTVPTEVPTTQPAPGAPGTAVAAPNAVQTSLVPLATATPTITH